MEIVYDLDNIGNAAKDFLQMTKNYKVFAFSGDLGAGKTSFINVLCKYFGVKGPVTSPTFSIIQEYVTHNNEIIYHIDLYRIKNEREATDTGVEDCITSNEICMVEWPERALNIFPKDTVFTNIQILSPFRRKLIVSKGIASSRSEENIPDFI